MEKVFYLSSDCLFNKVKVLGFDRRFVDPPKLDLQGGKVAFCLFPDDRPRRRGDNKSWLILPFSVFFRDF